MFARMLRRLGRPNRSTPPPRRLCFGIAAACLLASACAAAAHGEARVVSEAEPIVSPYGELFPALALATAAAEGPGRADAGAAASREQVLGDRDGFIGARVLARRNGESVRLLLRIPELGASGELSTTLANAGQRYALFPPMHWNAGRLVAAAPGAFATLEFDLSRDGAPGVTRRSTLRLHGVGEAPYYLDDGAASADLGWIFAAFVDETDPAVLALLGEARALSATPSGGFAGAGLEAAQRDAFSLWYALERRGLKYSPLTVRANLHGRVWIQRVRTLSQSLSDRSANCVDGSVLFASMLGAAGLDAALVRVPGHMFVRFALDPSGSRYAYLETTLLNDARVRPAAESVAMDEVDPDLAASRRRFEAALASGAQQYRRAAAELRRGASPEYRVIEIAEARRLGVHALMSHPAVSIPVSAPAMSVEAAAWHGPATDRAVPSGQQ
jgi:hypothetical protein